MSESDCLCLYGTTERPQTLRPVQVGPLSFLFSHDSMRRISWHGTELLRAISWPIRDESWGTYPPESVEEVVEGGGDTFRARINFKIGGGRLDCALQVEATGQGDIRADLTMSPVGESFSTNRAGFTVLHPIQGVAGEPLAVTHSDGTSEDTAFPRMISPDQPVMDIRGLRYSVGAASVDIAFEGEVFEMEDQRNWSDASYKTYCVPLVHPFTYVIDTPVTQTCHLSLSGNAAADGASSTGSVSAAVTDWAAPAIGLALEKGWLGGPGTKDMIAECDVSHVLVRVPPDADPAFLSDSADLARRLDAEVDVEIVLPDGAPVDDGLKAVAETLEGHGLGPTRVLALSEGYLASHQPSGPWPAGPAPAAFCKSARHIFPDAAIGGGMMTNFTEMNRCQPDPALCDYITHGGTAIVHASDDMSVIETLETIPQIFESAEALGKGKAYRLGLISIGMRSNPYGAAVAANPQQVRRTMAGVDPRQRGLFGAAWAVGVLAATEGSAVEALCLAAPTGPFGIVYSPQGYPQAGYDDGGGVVYPLFHVLREACRMSGGARLQFTGLPRDVSAYGVLQNGACQVMFANISEEPQSVHLGHEASVSVMDTDTCDQAKSAVDWLDKASRHALSQINLGPFAVGFATWSD